MAHKKNLLFILCFIFYIILFYIDTAETSEPKASEHADSKPEKSEHLENVEPSKEKANEHNPEPPKEKANEHNPEPPKIKLDSISEHSAKSENMSEPKEEHPKIKVENITEEQSKIEKLHNVIEKTISTKKINHKKPKKFVRSKNKPKKTILLINDKKLKNNSTLKEYSKDKDTFRTLCLIEKRKLEETIKEYDSRIIEIDQSLLDEKFKRERIDIVSKKMSDQRRMIPYEIENSKNINSMKIDAFMLEKERLNDLALRHKIRLKELTEKVKTAFPNESLDWWTIDKKLNIFIKTSSFQNELINEITKNGIAEWVKMSDNNILNVSLPILFSSGDANIADTYKIFLQKLGTTLAPYPIKIKVEGYTDNRKISIKSKFNSNWDLGAKRAMNVADELIKGGISESSFILVSHREHGDDDLDDSMMRRVDIEISLDKDMTI